MAAILHGYDVGDVDLVETTRCEFFEDPFVGPWRGGRRRDVAKSFEVVLVAGIASEEIFLKDAKLSASDLERADRVIREYDRRGRNPAPPDVCAQIREDRLGRARGGIVRFREREVVAIAEALISRRLIKSDEVTRMVNRVGRTALRPRSLSNR